MNKTLNFKTFKTFLQLILLVVSVFGFSQSYTPGPTNPQINAALIGNNINIAGGTLNFGDRATQIATFTGGTAAGLSMNTGAFFSTGTVTKLLTTNNATESSDDIPTTATFNDADLTAIDANATRDVVSYSFTVTLGPKATTLNIRYQFGSEEYPDYVGTNYNDVFGFFVTGPGISGTANLAKLPNNNPTSINKVNFGTPGYNTAVGGPVAAYDGSQSALYINNGHNTTVSGGKLVQNTNPGPFPVAVQFNGITRLITYSLSGLTPGGTYTFKIVIADAVDERFDSGVFINTIYGTATLIANNDTYTIVSGSTSTTSVLNNDSVNGAAPASLSDVFLSQVSTTNTGVSLDPLTGKINVAAGTPAGTYTVTYQICDQTFTSNCKTATATITVQINDSDNDGIDNYYDLDDDNDGILDDTELRCDYTPNVYPFTSGNGATKNQLLIFDWSGATLTNVNDTFTTSKIVNGVTYTAKATVVAKINTVNTVTGTGSAVANIINTWAGGGNQMFWKYANYGNTAADDLKGVLLFSLNNAVGNKLSIRFDMTATRSGVNQIFDAIAFDGESTAPSEKGVYTTNASNWTLVDYLGGTPALTEASISGNQLIYDDTQTNGKSLFAYTRGTNISITGDYTYEGINARAQAMGVGVWLYCDADNDGTPNYLDLDSDNDGCADAIEGSENVKYNQIHALDLPASDTNYAYRGQIKVKYDGVTTGSPSQIISTSASANGVPQLLNNAGNNLNASTNPSNLAGTVDNTDGTADVGQGIGASQDNTINSCKCYKAPSTDGNTYPTQHGITAFSRAGADNQNWPMVRQSGWTALEASTKGFVINRMPVNTSGENIGEPVDGSNKAVITFPIAGMMFYDTINDCLKINVDGTRSGWKCFNKQTCPDEN